MKLQIHLNGWYFSDTGQELEGMRRSLAVELAPIRVNPVYPSTIETERFDAFPEEVPKAALERFAKQTLLNKVGQPQDIAEAYYLYFMKDSFATGQTIISDGGSYPSDGPCFNTNALPIIPIRVTLPFFFFFFAYLNHCRHSDLQIKT